MRVLVPLLLVLPSALCAQARTGPVRPRPGLVITGSARLAPGSYRLAAPGDSALITIRGSDLEVDFTGVALDGAPAGADPDAGRGIAVLVDGGRNVVIRGLRARGYRVGILVRGTAGLKLNGNDLSHNWKPRLFSLVEHESLADWLSFHHNERGEWLRFGAGIYLDGVTRGDVQGNTVRQGMNGLLVNRSERLRIEGNDFSFNSGLGIGLYRSSDNVIAYNTVEYDVRGYSHGFYRRGQDSAGILMYEQSCRNVVAWNSVTHGGDGLFVWAGQSTMDSGLGGVNDNLFFGNDFSWAPTNGMEATFSRNAFVANIVEGSDYGLWGGYSYSSTVLANRFTANRVGIAIEHGQDNVITGNFFDRDTTAVSLWANAIEPSDWGYPRARDTRSRDVRVERNVFGGNRTALRAINTAGLTFADNRWAGVDSLAVLRDTSGVRIEGNERVGQAAWLPPRPTDLAAFPTSVGGAYEAPRSPFARRDRSTIVVDEWGPYDWRSPRLWPLDSTRAVPLRLRVLGPPGRWRLVSRRGIASLSSGSGRTGDTVLVTPAADAAGDWELVLEYRGAETVSPSGERRGAGVPVRFSWRRLEPRQEWTVRFYAWTDSTSPSARPDAFAELLRGTPLLERREPRLDYLWYRPTIAGVPQARYALEATGLVTLPAGDWTVRTISDDAVRVWADGIEVIQDWTPHESAVDCATLTGGTHRLRVQYYQVDGWTELRLDIVPGTRCSAGSPGPH